MTNHDVFNSDYELVHVKGVQRLAGHKYDEYHIDVYDTKRGNLTDALTSYATFVAYRTKDGFIGCHGLYSATTRKHIGWFAHYLNSAYGYDIPVGYQVFKACFEGHYEFNPVTGEIRDY